MIFKNIWKSIDLQDWALPLSITRYTMSLGVDDGVVPEGRRVEWTIKILCFKVSFNETSYEEEVEVEDFLAGNN